MELENNDAVLHPTCNFDPRLELNLIRLSSDPSTDQKRRHFQICPWQTFRAQHLQMKKANEIL